MGDDEHEPDPTPAPISKRKAPADESASGRKPHKFPRLDLNGGTGAGRLSSSSSSASPSVRDAGHASRTQPAPPPSSQKNFKKPLIPERLRVSRTQSSSSGASTSDFPPTLSQMVQKANARDKEKERERTQRAPPATARKHATQAKNVHKVTTANLLKDAQKPSASPIVHDWSPTDTSCFMRILCSSAISRECCVIQATEGMSRLDGRVSEGPNVCPRLLCTSPTPLDSP